MQEQPLKRPWHRETRGVRVGSWGRILAQVEAAEPARRLDRNRRAVNTAEVKTTFDLPDPLLRKAKALAAQQGRPLRDLVAEAIGEKLEGAMGAVRAGRERKTAWELWKTRLEQLPDGSWFNPEGIEDDSLFQSLDEIRREPWESRDPFGSDT
jgi:hypothetical protein